MRCEAQIGSTTKTLEFEAQIGSTTKTLEFEDIDIDDDIQTSEFSLQKNVPLGLADLGLFAIVGPRTIHIYDKLRVVVLSTDSGKIRDSNKIMLMRMIHDFDSYSESFQTAILRIYSNETSVIQTLQPYPPIIHVQFNQLINYLDPRPEYIRVIIIEWSIKFSIPIARIISADIQYSLLNARRCENFDDYSQQVD
ncbi:unnamed protein product [Rotaria socialis]|uniref:Uncharacterized protein n=1 Tax=Rotaria socialis TaxID=392032 RepID=A0A819VAF5_9BILA|nr:unnamed protein product [Rotaria socialis]